MGRRIMRYPCVVVAHPREQEHKPRPLSRLLLLALAFAFCIIINNIILHHHHATTAPTPPVAPVAINLFHSKFNQTINQLLFLTVHICRIGKTVQKSAVQYNNVLDTGFSLFDILSLWSKLRMLSLLLIKCNGNGKHKHNANCNIS